MFYCPVDLKVSANLGGSSLKDYERSGGASSVVFKGKLIPWNLHLSFQMTTDLPQV